MNDKDRVLADYPTALCVQHSKMYQIEKLASENSLFHESLSSSHFTEELAWHFAALRVRLEERAKSRMKRNHSLVMRTYSNAYCAHLNADFYQIRRLRLGEDKPCNRDYVPLSGRFS